MTDKNVSTEYTGVYIGIFPNMSPREIELEARVKELKRKVKLMMDCPDCKVDEYKKALDEIEEECNYAPMCDTEFSQRVLDIINKIKG